MMRLNERITAATPPVPHAEMVGLVAGSCPGCGRVGEHTALRLPGDPPEAGEAREFFTYAQCLSCETLFYADAPADPAKIYNPDYYSMRPTPRPTGLKGVAVSVRDRVTLDAPDRLSGWLGRRSQHPSLPSLRPMLRGEFGRKFTRRDFWLDVGCGHGDLLKTMRAAGFKDLTGADPFMPPDRESGEPGLRLYRKAVSELRHQYDVVMMHHAMEHAEDPESLLRDFHEVVRPGGVLMIRIPVVSSYAWRTYGGEWGNLDAPRHLTLWSEKGFRAAAERCGWTVRKTLPTSTARTIIQSEARLRGETEQRGRVEHLFSAVQMAEWKAFALALNSAGQGDELAFYLTAPR